MRDCRVSMSDPEALTAAGVPWNVWDVLRAAGLVVAASATALVVLVLLEPGPALTAVALVLPHSSLLAAVWVFGVRKHGTGWRPLGFVATPQPRGLLLPWLVLLASLGSAALYVSAVSALGLEALVPPSLPHELLGEGVVRILSIAGVGLAGPLIEEVFFRGFLLAALIKPLGTVRAVVVASAVFSAAHVSVPVVIPLFVTGLLLSWLYLRTGSIWPPFAAHAAQNLLALAVTLAALGEA